MAFKKGYTPHNKGMKGFKTTGTFWNKGIERPEITGENHPNWLGGKSFEPYSLEFNKSLKRRIRRRDKCVCQLCWRGEKEFKRKLSIHHIDYNKQNCKDNNLTTLCTSCNNKVNYNRHDWTKHFKEMYE